MGHYLFSGNLHTSVLQIFQEGNDVQMLLTVREMGVLCALHAGSLPATIDVLQSALSGDKGQNSTLMADIKSLAEKLSQMKEGDKVCLAFVSAE
jgi:hypothetical protein